MNFLEYRRKELDRATAAFIKDVKENLEITVRDLINKHKELSSIHLCMWEDPGYNVETLFNEENDEAAPELQESLDRLGNFLYNSRSILGRGEFLSNVTYKR